MKGLAISSISDIVDFDFESLQLPSNKMLVSDQVKLWLNYAHTDHFSKYSALHALDHLLLANLVLSCSPLFMESSELQNLEYLLGRELSRMTKGSKLHVFLFLSSWTSRGDCLSMLRLLELRTKWHFLNSSEHFRWRRTDLLWLRNHAPFLLIPCFSLQLLTLM
jgi:hypothetical protein